MSATRSVLIIGGSGFVGTHLALKLREGFKVFATYRSRYVKIPGVTCLPFNVANRGWSKRVIHTASPDAIIFAAGSNSVDLAEAHPRETERVHTGGPATIAGSTDITQAKLIYLSNCYTFDGHRGNYHESDVVLPSTVLGKAKFGGENFIRGRAISYVVVRASPLFGRGNGWNMSFLDRLRMKLDRGERVDLAASALHSFAPVSGFVELISRIVESTMRNRVVHYGGLTKTSYYDFAVKFAQRFGYDPRLIFPGRHAEDKYLGESTTLDFSLNSTYAAQTLKIKPLVLEEGLDLLEKELIPRF